MSGADRHVHEHALRLVAAQIDFDLAPGEVEELRAHLDVCAACRREAGAMPGDAARLDFPVYPALPSRRVDDAVHAEIARRRRPAGSALVLVAATFLLVALLGVAAGGAFLLRDAQPDEVAPTLPPGEVVVPSPPPDSSPAPSPDSTSPTGEPGWTAVPGTLPAAAGGAQLAPGPYGGLYVLVNEPGGAVLALLDAAGRPRDGWPTALPGWTCDDPAATSVWAPGVAPDGSVRVVCHDSGTEGEDARAFAFDAAGQPMGGWPVAIPGRIAAPPRVVDGVLVVVARDWEASPGAYRLVTVGADGVVRNGARFEAEEVAGGLVSIGPDGTAYLVAGNDLTAFDLDGARDGWPVRVEGSLSALAFGSNGRVFLTSTAADGASTRLRAIDAGGRVAEAGPGDLPIAGVSAWSGAGTPGGPIAPLVAPDGTTYVIGEDDGETVVYGINAAGAVMAGWPYRDPATLAWRGTCPEGSAGCGVLRSTPAVGPDATLYLPVGAVGPAAGGSLVALGRDGKVVPGWPVGLVRSGADFWSVVVGSDETLFALAVEPEAGGGRSATVLDIAIDSSVRYTTTVVLPGAE